MIKLFKRFVCAALVIIFMFAPLSGCVKTADSGEEFAVFTSFRDIPGITDEEIKAIDAIRGQTDYFRYSVLPTTEAFYNINDGSICGWAALLCEWLGELFEIPVVPEFVEWNEYLSTLASFEIDFSGYLTATEERRNSGYYMTETIAMQTVRYYRIMGSPLLGQIEQTRRLRYAFIEGSITVDEISPHLKPDTYDIIYVGDTDEAYEALRSGEADAFFNSNMLESAFDIYGNVVAYDFLPLVVSPVSLATRNPDLAPFISVVDKALANGASKYLHKLYTKGYQEYKANKFFMWLTDEEKEFLHNPPIVKVAAEYWFYPVSYYNTYEKRWEGIAFDIFYEIEKITGLKFEVANNNNAEWGELVEMLEDGRVDIICDLMQTPTRLGRFIWPATMYKKDTYALISKTDLPSVDFGEIPYSKIGLITGIGNTEMFLNWFPNATDTTFYESSDDVFADLDVGKIDLAMLSTGILAEMTNYHELSGYKANYMFSDYEYTFGFNKNQTVLCSIIDKALMTIDTDRLAQQWDTRSYDYHAKLLEAQRPWLIGVAFLSLLILALVTTLFARSRLASKHLEKLVGERTNELELQTREFALQTATLNTLIDSIPDLLYTKNLNLKFTHVNKSLFEYYGVSKEDMLGKSEEDIWLPGEYVESLEDLNLKVIREETIIKLEEQLLNADGTFRTFETIRLPIKVNGVISGVMGIGHDITERKAMEIEMNRQKVILQTLIDLVPCLIYWKDLELKYVLGNKFANELFGLTQNDIIGKTNREIGAFTGSISEIIDKLDKDVLESNKMLTTELWVNTGENIKQLFTTSSLPFVVDGELIGVISVAFDITERKAMEQAALAASQSKSSFLANMSHELRTPLNVVIGLTDLILEENHLARHVSENMRKISSAGNTLLNIVNDILDISKIESGMLAFVPTEYYISSLLNDVTTLVTTRIDEKPVAFRLNISDDLPKKLYGDDLRVKQILNNLLSNATKYTSTGTITLNVGVEWAGSKDVWLEIMVTDTGTGIREEDMQHLFTDYYQVDSQANRRNKGTGLGLSITKRLTEMMDGTISVESVFGQGTIFKVRIKQGTVNNETIGSSVADSLRKFIYSDEKRNYAKKLERIDLRHARVLVVDDMQTNLDVVAGLLRKYKMQVECVTNGYEALERIRFGRPYYNVVFMDHMMPGMDGIETTDAIRALGTDYARQIPIIALTANAIHGTVNIFYEHDFQDFVSKPIDIMQLDSAVRKWIRNTKPEEDEEAGEKEEEPIEISDLNIQGLNTEKGMALFGWDEEFYLMALRSYVENAPAVIDKIRSVTKETLNDYAVNIHGLKSISANIGAEITSNQAKTITVSTQQQLKYSEQIHTAVTEVSRGVRNFVSAAEAAALSANTLTERTGELEKFLTGQDEHGD
ncbi:MAG: transporter substrate-binding domain-containing protein [Oscillospiraceae bacterium]|nr:transporter substrate-binding domain-containing protein [Oscillospiraceae bacterium]